MLPERLQARIRHQLSLPVPDLEARGLATELAELAQRARERLEQCAALIRLGNEQAALQAAESEPSLPELCAWVSFSGSTEWARLCEKHGLPVAPAPDDAHVLAVELLYGRPIDENHPLYRDYRQAIRERDEARALAVLRSITSVNPGDGNAQAELNRLRAKFMRDSLAKVGELFARDDAGAAVQMIDRMEQLGTATLVGDPTWDDAMRRRAAWVQGQGRRRLDEHAARAAQARAADDWRGCADEIGAARTLERNAGVRAEGATAETLAGCESWAAEHVAAEAAENRARSEADALRSEWTALAAEAGRRESADLLRRINQWIERAELAADRVGAERLDEADALSRAVHQRVVRRHTLRTAAGVAALLTLVLAGHLTYQSLRAQSALGAAVDAVQTPLDAWDFDAADRALAAAEKLATTPELRAELDARSQPLRQRLRELRGEESALAAEAAFLAETRARGIEVANFAETQRRARGLAERLATVGQAAAARIQSKSGDLPELVAACETVKQGLREHIESLMRELAAAVGTGETIQDPAKAEEALARIRAALGAPGANIAVGNETGDRALALAERVGQRLAIERAREGSLRRLDAVGDLRAYLAALATLAADPAESPERKAAQLVTEAAPQLSQLPRNLLAPRLGAMWDAAATSDPGFLALNPEEAVLAARLTDDATLRSLRKYIIREHISPEPGVTETRTRESEYVAGKPTVETRRLKDYTETVYTAKVLRSSGDLVEVRWNLVSFSNGVVSGKEPTEGLPLPEVEYQGRFARFFSTTGGRLAESPLRTMERVRRESGSPMLRAYHLQELFRLAEVRPAVSGLAFSPSAQRDAAELRGITQNGLLPTEFAFSNDTALKAEIGKFLARGNVSYVAESQFLRALAGALRRGGMVFAGRAGPDGKPVWKTAPTPGSVIVGVDTEGRAAVLFECDSDGTPQTVSNPAPLSPLLRLSTTPAEAAVAAGQPPPSLAVPSAGWNSLLKGKDL